MSVTLSPETVVLRPDGIVHYDFRGERVDLPTAQAMIAAAREAMGSDVRPRPALVQLHRAVVDQAARRYLSFSKEQRQITSMCAMIAGNPISRVIGNFFVGLNRPDIPTRLFGDEASAVAWLLADGS